MKFQLLAILLLLNCSHAENQIGALNPLSEFWRNRAHKDYPEFLHENTKFSVIVAPSFIYPMRTNIGHRFVISISELHDQYTISLREIYEDGEKQFEFSISEKETQKIIEAFQHFLKKLEPYDPIGHDGTSYLLRIKGDKNEFGYTWSPETFTIGADLVSLAWLLRENCIQCLDEEFTLNDEIIELGQIIQLTPDEIRTSYTMHSHTLDRGHGPVDPFAESTEEPDVDAILMNEYKYLQLKLKFSNERKKMLTRAR